MSLFVLVMAFVRGCSVSLTGTGPDRAGASARRRLVYRAVRNGHRVVMSVKWTERREEEEEDEGEEEQGGWKSSLKKIEHGKWDRGGRTIY